jgi:curved DNA-binding protein CbpA
MRDKIKIYCEILGLSQIPTQEELSKVWKKLLKECHPDYFESKGETLKERADQKTKKINEAYTFLKNEDLSQYSSNFRAASSRNYTSSWRSERKEDPSHYGETPKKGFPDPDVYEIFLESNYAPSAGYNEKTNTMYVRVVWGSVYKYFNVPQNIFEELMDTCSKGFYIRHSIMDKFQSEECFAPFLSYRGGDAGLKLEKKKSQDRASRRNKINAAIKEMIEFLFNNPSPLEIEKFLNNPSLPDNYRVQIRKLANPLFQQMDPGAFRCEHILKEWNYSVNQYPYLRQRVTQILKKEKNRGVITRKGVSRLYFDKATIFQVIRAGTWDEDGHWLRK